MDKGLQAVGLAFARLPGSQQQQQQYTRQLLATVRQVLPNMAEEQLRKKLLQEPNDKLQGLQEQIDQVVQALHGNDAHGPSATGEWMAAAGPHGARALLK